MKIKMRNMMVEVEENLNVNHNLKNLMNMLKEKAEITENLPFPLTVLLLNKGWL